MTPTVTARLSELAARVATLVRRVKEGKSLSARDAAWVERVSDVGSPGRPRGEGARIPIYETMRACSGATGFADDGRPTPVVDPVYPDDESVAPRPDRSDAARTWVRLLQWLASGGDARRAGARVIVLASVLKLPGAPRNVRELGKALGMSHTHAWRLCDKVRSEIAAIGRNDHC